MNGRIIMIMVIMIMAKIMKKMWNEIIMNNENMKWKMKWR